MNEKKVKGQKLKVEGFFILHNSSFILAFLPSPDFEILQA